MSDHPPADSAAWTYKLKTAVIGILCLAIYFALQLVFPEIKAFALAMSVGVLYIIGAERWKYRSRVWFWTYLFILGVIHCGVIIALPMPDFRGPSILVFPLMVIDTWVSLFILDKIDRRLSDPDRTTSR